MSDVATVNESGLLIVPLHPARMALATFDEVNPRPRLWRGPLARRRWAQARAPLADEVMRCAVMLGHDDQGARELARARVLLPPAIGVPLVLAAFAGTGALSLLLRAAESLFGEERVRRLVAAASTTSDTYA